MFRPAYLFLIALILPPCISHAKTETIFADHKYVMGDNDSKNDARHMCFLEAKRKVLEKAGTYIESHTQAKNFQLTKDEINSYSAALLKVETVKEEWKMSGENMAIFMTVKAEVDTGYIEDQLAKIKKDTSVQKKIKDQQAQLQELENKIDSLQKQLLSSTNQIEAVSLRKDKASVFVEIDQIEARYKHIMLALHDRKKASVELAHRILKFIEIDMTSKEVEYIVGKPDHIEYCHGTNRIQSYIYAESFSINFNCGFIASYRDNKLVWNIDEKVPNTVSEIFYLTIKDRKEFTLKSRTRNLLSNGYYLNIDDKAFEQEIYEWVLGK